MSLHIIKFKCCWQVQQFRINEAVFQLFETFKLFIVFAIEILKENKQSHSHFNYCEKARKVLFQNVIIIRKSPNTIILIYAENVSRY